MPTILCVGQAVQDFIFSVDEMPARAEKYQAAGFISSGGGPAGSAAVAISRLGGKARLLSRLGQDSVGDLIIEELGFYGVETSLVKRFSNCQSSLSAVMVDREGERLIVNYLDPGLPKNAAWLVDIRLDHVDGILADSRWPEAATIMLNKAKTLHLPAVLDADQLGHIDNRLLGAATHVAFSEEGLTDYAGHGRYEEAISEINKEFAVWCCVTLGRRGVLYSENGKLSRLPSFQVKAVETLGAGDVWHGGFAFALTEGFEEPEAVRFACAAAAIKVTRTGGRAGIPTRSEVENFLMNN